MSMSLWLSYFMNLVNTFAAIKIEYKLLFYFIFFTILLSTETYTPILITMCLFFLSLSLFLSLQAHPHSIFVYIQSLFCSLNFICLFSNPPPTLTSLSPTHSLFIRNFVFLIPCFLYFAWLLFVCFCLCFLSVSVFLLSKYKQTKRLGWDRYISEHTHAFYKLHFWTTTTKYNSVCLSFCLSLFVSKCVCV